MNRVLSVFTAALGMLATASLLPRSADAGPPRSREVPRWEPVPELTDEFDGDELDETKWHRGHPFWKGRVPSRFKAENTTVERGFLVLRNTSRVDSMDEVARPFEDVWIDAAALVSRQKLAQPGWYYEAKMRVADTAMSGSFWFRVGEYSEIDVVEHIGHATKPGVDARTAYKYECNTHVYGPHKGPKPIGDHYRMRHRGRDRFVTYGLWWKDPSTLWFYYNDKKVMEVTPAVPFEEKLHMIFDTEALNSKFVGLPTVESLKDPRRNATRVDWVRAWRPASPDAE